MKNNKDQELAISWVLIVTLKTAMSAAFLLHKEHLREKEKQRVGRLYKLVTKWMKQTSAINRKNFEGYDDLIEENASAALETLLLVAHLDSTKVDQWMEGVNKLYNDLKPSSNGTTTST